MILPINNKSGFTLIELIMVIVILAILALVAIPKYSNLTVEAKDASEKGVVGGVRAGIHTYVAKNKTFPSDLDAIATYPTVCSTAVPCFDTVLGQGGIASSDWSKTAALKWTGPLAVEYTYTPADGAFK